MIGKFITCALAIGSGQSLGPEDPSLQMGAGIASALGRRLHLSREKVRLIAPVGAAAGLAAAFNAPISAVLFVIEEVIGTWSAGILGAVVLAAVSAWWWRGFFSAPSRCSKSRRTAWCIPRNWWAYAVLGVVGGLSLAGIRKAARCLCGTRPGAAPLDALPAAGPGGTRSLESSGLKFPAGDGRGLRIHGSGHAWPVSVAGACGAGAAEGCWPPRFRFPAARPGGMFAPTLFIGAMMGAAVGTVAASVFSRPTPVRWARTRWWAWARCLPGSCALPMTSVFMVLEVSGNYSIILPVMISNTIAYLIGRRFQPTPIFDVITREEGLDLPSMEEDREQTALLVENAMRKPVGP